MLSYKKNLSSYVLLTLVMLALVFILLAHIFANKELQYPLGGISSPGMLTFPLAFITLDIIAEIYGYHFAKQVVWTSIIAQASFFFLGVWLAYLPDPNNISNFIPSQNYQSIFGILPRVFIASLIGMILGSIINVKLISKWKILLKGKHFWLRSLGASAIGNLIFIFIGTFLICINRFPLPLILKFSATAYFIELSALVIIAPLANLITLLLKIALKNERPYLGLENNPFKDP